MIVAYDGSAYHGWQRQAKGIDTIQLRIEQVAMKIMGHRVILHGAGRTDAGVHAAGQVANFYTTNMSIPLKGMRRAINSRLPNDIVIRSTALVKNQFNSSRSAIGKTYQYRIWIAPSRPVMQANQIWHYIRPLNVDAMIRAGARMIGTHDFRGFTTTAETRPNTVRTIFRCDVARVGCEIVITVQGDGFLYNMVRNIVGTLTEIGRGRWGSNQIDTTIATRDRKQAGPTAPAAGLSMVCVHYRPEDLVVS